MPEGELDEPEQVEAGWHVLLHDLHLDGCGVEACNVLTLTLPIVRAPDSRPAGLGKCN